MKTENLVAIINEAKAILQNTRINKKAKARKLGDKIEVLFGELANCANCGEVNGVHAEICKAIGDVYTFAMESGVLLDPIYRQLIPQEHRFFELDVEKAEKKRLEKAENKKRLKINLNKIILAARDQELKTKDHRILPETVEMLVKKLDGIDYGHQLRLPIHYAIGDIYRLARDLKIPLEEKYLNLVPTGFNSSYYQEKRPVRRLKKVRRLLDRYS